MPDKKPTPKTLTCVITGEPIIWCGYGRPPKYSPAGARAVRAKARAKLRARKKAAMAVGGLPGLEAGAPA